MSNNWNAGSSSSKYDSCWEAKKKMIKDGLLVKKLKIDVANDFRSKTKRKNGFKLVYSLGKIVNSENHAARRSLISAIEADFTIKGLLSQIDKVTIELTKDFKLLIY